MKGLIPIYCLIALLALSGCTNPDAPTVVHGTPASASPQNRGEPSAPPPPSPASQAPSAVEPTPQMAIEAFARLYVNWTYRTLSANQRTLAAISVGAARLSERQAAATSEADTTIARGHISNHGQIVSIAQDHRRPNTWVIVTREQTGGDAQYEGLTPAYHVTLSQLAKLPGGYAISQWLPQN